MQQYGTIIYFVVIIAVFYFLLIRPQKKKDKDHKNMVTALKKGDEIITIGGFHAKVLNSKNGVLTVQIGDLKAKIDDWAVRSVEKVSNVKNTEEIEAAEIEEPVIDEVTDETKE